MSWDDEDGVFCVAVNEEEQYAIWPDYKPLPAGWKRVGPSGQKAECLRFIAEVWTDMRPLSLRRALETERNQQPDNTAVRT